MYIHLGVTYLHVMYVPLTLTYLHCFTGKRELSAKQASSRLL